MLSCRDRAAGVTPTKGKAIPGTGKGSPLLLPQQRLQALSWASPFQHSVVQERKMVPRLFSKRQRHLILRELEESRMSRLE